MKKINLSIAITAISACFLTGCGGSGESSSNPANTNPIPVLTNQEAVQTPLQNEPSVEIITETETLDDQVIVIDQVEDNEIVVLNPVQEEFESVEASETTTIEDEPVIEQEPIISEYQPESFSSGVLTTDNAELVTIEALNVINHAMRSFKTYLNYEPVDNVIGYSESNFTNVSHITNCGGNGSVDRQSNTSSNFGLYDHVTLKTNEAMSFTFTQCALSSNYDQMYLSGSKTIDVISGSYSESGLDGIEAITRLQFEELSLYSPSKQYDYINGDLLIGANENVLSLQSDQIAIRDTTLLLAGVDYQIENIEMDITKTINQIDIFSTYTMNSEPFTVHGAKSGMKYLVSVIDPIIINEQINGATVDGELNITSEAGLINVDIRSSYAIFKVDIDGDGITDFQDSINYINYR
jgi:hypothetical protein